MPAMPTRRRISQIPLLDRPREKLQRKGAAALSDFELLEVLIGNGAAGIDVGTIARHIHKHLQEGLGAFNLEILTSIRGVNTAHASKLIAALELAKRHLVRDAAPLKSVSDILARMDAIRTKQQEHLVCLSLDGGQRLIAHRTLTIGTLDTLLAHPREVFSDAIVDRAAAVVVVHNHPSGDPQPSQKDIELTQQLAAAGQLLGVPLRDHIICTKNDYFSYRQHHML